MNTVKAKDVVALYAALRKDLKPPWYIWDLEPPKHILDAVLKVMGGGI